MHVAAHGTYRDVEPRRDKALADGETETGGGQGDEKHPGPSSPPRCQHIATMNDLRWTFRIVGEACVVGWRSR